MEKTLGPGAFYLTMIRNPLDQFQSFWDYYQQYLGSFVVGVNLPHISLTEFVQAIKEGKYLQVTE